MNKRYKGTEVVPARPKHYTSTGIIASWRSQECSIYGRIPGGQCYPMFKSVSYTIPLGTFVTLGLKALWRLGDLDELTMYG